MNITGAQPMRLENHEIDQPDDMRVITGIAFAIDDGIGAFSCP